jgi:crotonobetainyl-CoA:carnitine CoA-transferase CaiB-like acyl-CoA transferase
VLQTPQIADRGFLKHYSDVPGVGRDIDVVTTGVKLDGHAVSVEAPPPELGQDNAAIWGALGLSPQEIERLRQEGAI